MIAVSLSNGPFSFTDGCTKHFVAQHYIQDIHYLVRKYHTPTKVIYHNFPSTLNIDLILWHIQLYALSPSGGHHSLLFDQGFQKIAGWH